MTWLSGALQSFTRLFKWWMVVAPWEQGLRVRGGKKAKPLGAGIHFRIPLLDRIYVVCTRLRVVKDSNQTVTTSDGRVVTVSMAVGYSIESLEALMAAVAMPEQTLMNIAEGVVAGLVSRTLSGDLDPTLIEQEVAAGISERVEGWGLGPIKVNVTGFAYVRTYRLLMNDYSTRTGMDAAFHGDEARKAATS